MKHSIKKSILSLLLINTIFAGSSLQTYANTNYLTGASTWAVSQIQEAYDNNLLTNLSDITSDYQAPITREQFCRLIMNCYDSLGGNRPTNITSKFTDTTNNQVLSANQLGIVSGMSTEIFSPEAYITREQLAKMAKSTMDLFQDTTLTTQSVNFKDSDSISNWALESVIFAQQEGLLVGDTNGNFMPLDNLSCEQAILVTLRIFDNVTANTPANTVDLSPTAVYEKITSLESEYPSKTPWNNSYSYSPITGYYSTAYGCAGFAHMLSDEAFNNLPERKIYSFDEIRVGDILRINMDTHSVIVLGIEGDTITIAEGNMNSSVLWGRTLSHSSLKSKYHESEYVLTRYPQ